MLSAHRCRLPFGYWQFRSRGGNLMIVCSSSVAFWTVLAPVRATTFAYQPRFATLRLILACYRDISFCGTPSQLFTNPPEGRGGKACWSRRVRRMVIWPRLAKLASRTSIWGRLLSWAAIAHRGHQRFASSIVTTVTFLHPPVGGM